MPGKGHFPDLQERILRGLKANTNRTAGGLGSNASPGMTRDRMAAMRRGAPASGTTATRASKIDPFEIADDSDSSFTLTYTPIVDSWNLELNGVRVHGAEFSISGKTLSIVDAADLFLGADTQATPWLMEIQYDYLTGVPAAANEPAEFPATAIAGEQASPAEVAFAAPPAAGHSVLLVYNSKFSGGITGTVTGLGATWTKIAGVSGGVGGDSRPSELWVGVGCNGSGDTITLVGGDSVFGLYALEVNKALTTAGEQHDTDVSASATGPITATGHGVAVSVMLGGGTGPVDAPTDWITLQAQTGPHPRCMYRATSNGETVELTTSTAFGHALIAVVKYA